MKKEHNLKSVTDVAKQLGELWAKIDPTEKAVCMILTNGMCDVTLQKYEAQHEELKAEYAKAKEAYAAQKKEAAANATDSEQETPKKRKTKKVRIASLVFWPKLELFVTHIS